MPHISVILPATNEEAYIERAIDSVRAQHYPHVEILVVVNGAEDATASIARRLDARVIEFPHALLASGARNQGARLAFGKWYVFLDADSVMGPGVLEAIASLDEVRFGTVLGKPDPAKLRYRFFFLIKNIAHRLGLYHGVLGGLFFTSARLFHKIGGYDASLKVNEISDIIARTSTAGGVYTLLTSCSARTSMRRFEQLGLIRPLAFWVWVKFVWLWEGKRPRIGEAYASAQDRLFR